MSLADSALFLACVAIATCAQTVTGFAFGLILLGLVGMFHLAPLADAANVASMLSIANAFVVLRGPREQLDVGALRKTLIGSSVGVAIGVSLLGWLTGNVVAALRFALGVTILACAFLLWAQVRPLRQRSSNRSFVAFGLLSGLMSGLFASAGPPLVYQFYRQPLSPLAIRQTLGAIFAANALLRLALVISSGQFERRALFLGLLAVPLVLALTWWIKHHPPKLPLRLIRASVCLLLVLTGANLTMPAVLGWFVQIQGATLGIFGTTSRQVDR